MVLSLVGSVLLFVIAGVAAFGGGPDLQDGFRGAAMIVPLAAGLALMAWAVVMGCLLELTGKSESHAFRTYDALLDVKAAIAEQTRHLRLIADNTQLSDAALSIAHRDREQSVLHQAINESIVREDWEGAYYLVEQLDRRFGYKLEAGQLRGEIDSSRSTLIERKIGESVQQVRNLIATHEWDRARRNMDHLTQHHPEHPAVKELPLELESRWDEHKRRLLKEWDQAIQRDDIDNGIRILRELDQYLSPNEAEALKEGARDVFRAKLHNLGVQFSIAVTERQWSRALEIGDQIIAEFPNSRMAREVREKRSIVLDRAQRARRKQERAAAPAE
ncbi:MAG: hypothetical protein V3T70_01115 [Phycisphaerae bacterium]